MLLPRKRNRPKGIQSPILFVFFSRKKRYFSLKNVKYKDYISSQFVETTHLRLICIWRMKSRSDRRQEKAITKFSPHVFKSPTFQGSNDIW